MCGKKRHTKADIRSEMSELICGRIAAGENYNLTRDSMNASPEMMNFRAKAIVLQIKKDFWKITQRNMDLIISDILRMTVSAEQPLREKVLKQ